MSVSSTSTAKLSPFTLPTKDPALGGDKSTYAISIHSHPREDGSVLETPKHEEGEVAENAKVKALKPVLTLSEGSPKLKEKVRLAADPAFLTLVEKWWLHRTRSLPDLYMHINRAKA